MLKFLSKEEVHIFLEKYGSILSPPTIFNNENISKEIVNHDWVTVGLTGFQFIVGFISFRTLNLLISFFFSLSLKGNPAAGENYLNKQPACFSECKEISYWYNEHNPKRKYWKPTTWWNQKGKVNSFDYIMLQVILYLDTPKRNHVNIIHCKNV